MEKNKKISEQRVSFLLMAISLASLFLFAFATIKYIDQRKTYFESKNNFERQISDTKTENENLLQTLQAKESEVYSLADQVGEIASTVGDLEKLKKLDSQLLQKYSKVYFLNEHYSPAELVEIDKEYLWNQDKIEKIQSRVAPYLQNLMLQAKGDAMDLKIISAFRSFAEQGAVKSGYTVTYGTGANKFSADQGYSEHQLGTTLDFTTTKVADTFSGFSKTKEYEWLLNNAYKYGFIISYPKENAYYQFEPWHWRFVGVDLAKRLHSENKFFYDMDQREIDTYLIRIFD